ncbi:hypothetical protein QP952_07805 [Corynebacterium pseudodiphtheriticum]|uniref:hypothetical protein n=1 Tax=Corynebacterium pseudodiphtheriticum TaxID=37637 RepID=UPI00254C6928|nr:hypothetical protein [Corynebacterium pseudodiphtheriticum]MDK8709574.1 hypothetical protein [Corynebacterium pseudodiphtheriticum]
MNTRLTTALYALIEVAGARGCRARWHRGSPKGAWLPHKHTISLRVGMDDATTLCSLAHELGHVHYGDPPGYSSRPPNTPQQKQSTDHTQQPSPTS